ncbi:3-hydroxyacyl-CoA dehydrogenase, NAD binding domain protein, partial [Ostertagia ostertagi]
MAQGKGKVAIVGSNPHNSDLCSGLIGSCWATLFVSAGYSVCLYDISDAQLDSAKKHILHNLQKLKESTCETVEFKKKVFSEMDKCASSEIILASSTSTIPASKFTEDLTH